VLAESRLRVSLIGHHGRGFRLSTPPDRPDSNLSLDIMSSMNTKPKPLTRLQLRRMVEDNLFTDCKVEETRHTREKHPRLSVFDIYYGLRQNWKAFSARFDNKRREWRYIVSATGFNDRPLKICFVIDDKKIRVITRFQDERKSG
jgi:hypothetical protein